MDPQTELLLQKSAQDEAMLRLEGVPDLIFGFHAQQAVEKLLKALFSERGLRYPRTHDLQLLHENLVAAGETLPAVPIPLTELNEYAVEYRYTIPNPWRK